MTLRLRFVSTVSTACGLIAVLLVVGALFPAVGHTIGRLKIPSSVAELLGGADYGTITGWFRSEIGSIYGPLVIAALAITGAVASTAGEEEDRILTLLLGHPLDRARLVTSRAVAIALIVVAIACAAWIGMLAGVAIGGGGIRFARIVAFAVQLAFFGAATGAVALALGAGTGRRALAAGVAAGVAILGWLINGFAPVLSGFSWLKYLSLFYYYAGHDPLGRGIDLAGIVVLGAVAVAGTALAIVTFERRDLRE